MEHLIQLIIMIIKFKYHSSSNINYDLNQWHHIVYNGSQLVQISLYLDGVLDCEDFNNFGPFF